MHFILAADAFILYNHFMDSAKQKKEGEIMYRPECGTLIPPGEEICKGCGKYSSQIREELLALSEKMPASKCKKCGADVYTGQHYCVTCGVDLKA